MNDMWVACLYGVVWWFVWFRGWRVGMVFWFGLSIWILLVRLLLTALLWWFTTDGVALS